MVSTSTSKVVPQVHYLLLFLFLMLTAVCGSAQRRTSKVLSAHIASLCLLASIIALRASAARRHARTDAIIRSFVKITPTLRARSPRRSCTQSPLPLLGAAMDSVLCPTQYRQQALPPTSSSSRLSGVLAMRHTWRQQIHRALLRRAWLTAPRRERPRVALQRC